MYFCKLFFFFLSPYQQFYHQGDSRRCEHESGLFVCQNAQAYFHLMTNGPEVVFSFIWFMFSRWPDDHLMINYIICVWMQTVCRSSHCCSSSSCHRHTHTHTSYRQTHDPLSPSNTQQNKGSGSALSLTLTSEARQGQLECVWRLADVLLQACKRAASLSLRDFTAVSERCLTTVTCVCVFCFTCFVHFLDC